MHQSKTLRTPDTPNDEFRSLMAERRELMMEYARAHARNIEMMRSMPQEIMELEDLENILIQSGSTLPNKLQGTKELELMMKASSAVMMGELMCPEQLMLRGHNAGSVKNSAPQRIGLIADSLFRPHYMSRKNSRLLENPSLGGDPQHLADAAFPGENGEHFNIRHVFYHDYSLT